MNWGHFDNFVHMGGYGLYVWGAYGVTLAFMLAEPCLAARRRRQALAQARAQADDARAATSEASPSPAPAPVLAPKPIDDSHPPLQDTPP